MKKITLVLATLLLVVAIAFSVNAKHRSPQTREKKECKCEQKQPQHRAPQVRERDEHQQRPQHRKPQTHGEFKGKTTDGKTASVEVGRLLTPRETAFLNHTTVKGRTYDGRTAYIRVGHLLTPAETELLMKGA